MSTPHLTGREAQRISLGQLLAQAATTYPDNQFITEVETDTTLTYDQFNRLTNRIAHGLRDLGIERGEYVGVMLINRIDCLAISYAIKKIGAVEVVINNTFRGVSLARMSNLTGCQTLFTQGQFLATLADVRDQLGAADRLIMLDAVDDAAMQFPAWDILPYSAVLSADETEAAIDIPDDEIACICLRPAQQACRKGARFRIVVRCGRPSR